MNETLEVMWLRESEVYYLLKHLPSGRRSPRKLRLAAVAFFRAWLKWPSHERFEECLQLAERLADGIADDSDRIRFLQDTTDHWLFMTSHFKKCRNAILNFHGAQAPFQSLRMMSLFYGPDALTFGPETERDAFGKIVHDVIGNPFSPIAVDLRWLTADVVDLAKAIYADRAFDRMPILADALMDAGCDNDDIIQHCRGPGPHVRGCWVVDLILGKT